MTAQRRAHTLKEIVTWNLTVLLAAVYVWSGWLTASGAEGMVEAFERFGLPDWFRITLGIGELIAGLVLLIKPLVGLAALGLSFLMLGALLTHLIHDPLAYSLGAVVLFTLLVVLMWLRRPVIPPFLQKFLC
ncbi:DoxX family protein [Natronospirillum operosum]|uniref:DoxX family protein n=1 Tax=Natronospirillum operosum TaxID=2759953 RepID=A0A4Z0WBP0_9GAMM|nr:DoxX family protein [Natronospirillum operosum]TGG92036.1 DoxX family protein [Natronospirillum operosum]